MEAGARTPEELEDLLEDAFVTRDPAALTPLFDEGAVLVAERGGREVRGEEIVRAAATMWRRQLTHLADPRRVLVSRGVALIVAAGGISVARRGAGGPWRYAISLLDREPTKEPTNEGNGK